MLDMAILAGWKEKKGKKDKKETRSETRSRKIKVTNERHVHIILVTL